MLSYYLDEATMTTCLNSPTLHKWQLKMWEVFLTDPVYIYIYICIKRERERERERDRDRVRKRG